MCMWTGLSEQAKNVKYFHHRVISVENFNDQVEKTTHSVDITQLLSPVTPVTAQTAHEHSGHNGGMKVCMGLA